ncbi:MAG: S24/S26 family peptidase [Methanobrevibacter sp.]|nr:S24/S26 family peptidase [Methanobrevibacter sp.]
MKKLFSCLLIILLFFSLSSVAAFGQSDSDDGFDIFDFFSIPQDSVDVYTDGENVSVMVNSYSDVDTDALENDIINFTFDVMDNPDKGLSDLKEGIVSICSDYGLENVELNYNSTLGEDSLPLYSHTEGISMLPTVQDGQCILINKTHDIHVGDLVTANSSEYGPICKRVADIDGDSVYLVSDNKKTYYEYHDDYVTEYKGITTWVDISDIDGVIVKLF